PTSQSIQVDGVTGCRALVEVPYPPLPARRLRLRGVRRDEDAPANHGDKRSTVHQRMISSARISSDCGIVRPSAFAVLRLMTSSNFVGCSTGISPGWAPFRILSTYVAARRLKSGVHAIKHKPPGFYKIALVVHDGEPLLYRKFCNLCS